VGVDPNNPKSNEDLISSENLDDLICVLPGHRPPVYKVVWASLDRIH
jgi:hypothetical protein